MHLSELLLPKGLLDYFNVLNFSENKDHLKIFLEEKNNIDNQNLESKGFYPNVLLNDFPVRGKPLLLDIRRRRWINKETSEYIQRDLGLIARGTSITEEFASFLKGLHR